MLVKRRHRSSDGRTITFQVDDEVLEAIEKLKKYCYRGVFRPQSALIRGAILDAAERIGKK
jgi:hypothetical protein